MEPESKTSVRATKNDRSFNLPFVAPQVGLEPTTLRLTAGCSAIELLRNIGGKLALSLLESGDDLLSRAVSSQVPSTLKGLTSVFGMGTGGTPSLLSPEMVSFSISFAMSDLSLYRLHLPCFGYLAFSPLRISPPVPSSTSPNLDNCTLPSY